MIGMDEGVFSDNGAAGQATNNSQGLTLIRTPTLTLTLTIRSYEMPSHSLTSTATEASECRSSAPFYRLPGLMVGSRVTIGLG